MNNEELTADRGRRAADFDEFLGPILADMRTAYTQRLADVATTELDPKKRAEKVTSLATAMKILDNVTTGLRCVIEDGKIAEANLLRAEKVELMSKSQRRIFDFLPQV